MITHYDMIAGKIVIHYYLRKPNGQPREHHYVEVTLNEIDCLPGIANEEMEVLKNRNWSIYFSEIFVPSIRKTLVLRFGGQRSMEVECDNVLEDGPFVLQN